MSFAKMCILDANDFTLLKVRKCNTTCKNVSLSKVTSSILSSVNKFADSVTGALQVNQKVTVKKPNMRKTLS